MNHKKILLLSFFFMTCLHSKEEKYKYVTFVTKDGVIHKETFSISQEGGSDMDPWKKFYVTILDEVASGNKENINKSNNLNNLNMSSYTAITSLLWPYRMHHSFSEKHFQALKYLLEQGADPNLTKTFIYDSEKTSKNLYLPLANIYPKEHAFGNYKETKIIALLLSFGAKINLKGRDKSALDIWKEELETDFQMQEFLVRVSLEIIKLTNRNKLDPDFLKLIESKHLDAKIIKDLKKYLPLSDTKYLNSPDSKKLNYKTKLTKSNTFNIFDEEYNHKNIDSVTFHNEGFSEEKNPHNFHKTINLKLESKSEHELLFKNFKIEIRNNYNLSKNLFRAIINSCQVDLCLPNFNKDISVGLKNATSTSNVDVDITNNKYIINVLNMLPEIAPKYYFRSNAYSKINFSMTFMHDYEKDDILKAGHFYAVDIIIIYKDKEKYIRKVDIIIP